MHSKTEPLWVDFVPMVRSINYSKGFHKSTRCLCFSLSLLELSVVFLGTKNAQTILKYRTQIEHKRFFYHVFFQHEEVSWLQWLPEGSCPSSPVFSMAVKFLVSQKQDVVHFVHCDCSIPVVSQPSRKGPGKAGISYLFDNSLVASSETYNLWRRILTEMAFQKSFSHRIWFFRLVWIFNFTWFSYQGKTREP